MSRGNVSNGGTERLSGTEGTLWRAEGTFRREGAVFRPEEGPLE